MVRCGDGRKEKEGKRFTTWQRKGERKEKKPPSHHTKRGKKKAFFEKGKGKWRKRLSTLDRKKLERKKGGGRGGGEPVHVTEREKKMGMFLPHKRTLSRFPRGKKGGGEGGRETAFLVGGGNRKEEKGLLPSYND